MSLCASRWEKVSSPSVEWVYGMFGTSKANGDNIKQKCQTLLYNFCIRYFLKLGFLDGVAGFCWHFWQGLWYRWLVDIEIGKMKHSAVK